MESSTATLSTRVSRRSLVKAGTVGAAALAGVAAASAVSSPAGAAGGKSINLRVTVDLGTFQSPADPVGGTGPFYVAGDIFAQSGGPTLGRFQCWGFISAQDGTGVVDQEFDLGDRGKITIAGIESEAPRAVTGGTGDFANARGEGKPSGGPGSAGGTDFTIDFNLTGAKGGPIT